MSEINVSRLAGATGEGVSGKVGRRSRVKRNYLTDPTLGQMRQG